MFTEHDGYQALLLLSVGGPETPEDVWPFLRAVAEGKNIPESRLAAVAERYFSIGGRSPHNAAVRALLAELATQLSREGPPLALYWGNRYWHPTVEEALQQMADDGIERALALALSPFGSYVSCRAYKEALERARQKVPGAPEIGKLRLFYNHPLFIEAAVLRIQQTLESVSKDEVKENLRVLFSAHSLPVAMAENGPYVRQFTESARYVAESLGWEEYDCVYQSRSGPPSQPWLEPDICDYLQNLATTGFCGTVLVMPLGFVVENMETAYDLDVQACSLAEELGLRFLRAGTVAPARPFLEMVRELVLERLDPTLPRRVVGKSEPWPDECLPDCCRLRKED